MGAWLDSFISIKRHLQEKMVLWHFVDDKKCYTCKYHFLDHFLQNFAQEQRRMDTGNCFSLTEFIFLGITDNIETKVILFTTFLLVYFISLLANLGMITLIRMDTQLHTSMYFFLSHLSCSGLSISAAVGRKMLVDLFAKKKSILFCGCALQLLVLYTFADSECLLLAVMAYDWYTVISSPLLYVVSMSSRVCSLLVWGLSVEYSRDFDIHDISIPLMFLWVKWD